MRVVHNCLTVLALGAVGVAISCLIPAHAYAWGPSTHLQFGLQILDQLSILPGELQVLLGFYRPQYLYGCISADIIVGKKFIAYRHHCHNWAVGAQLLAESRSDSMRAFMLGYMSHLAADTVAHNLFVPVKVLESYRNPAMGHMYWELLFDHQVGDERTRDMFYSLSRNPFEEEDRLLQRMLKPTLFSFATNKKIFNGLLILQRLARWQHMMDAELRRDPAAISDAEIAMYRELSLNAIIGYLIDRDTSIYCRLDPTGGEALEASRLAAKEFKRAALVEPASVKVAQEKLRAQFDSRLQRV